METLTEKETAGGGEEAKKGPAAVGRERLPGFPSLQPDGFVLDISGVEFEAVLRVMVHERPGFGGDHEISIDLR
jgi:hypothetical protein